MRFWKPVDGACTSVDLSVGVALCASGNVMQLPIIRFRRLVCSFRIRPIRNAGGSRGCRWIVGEFRRSLLGVSHMAHDKEEAASRERAQKEKRPLTHITILTAVDRWFLGFSNCSGKA
jgi:hypothetical protein